MSVTSSIQWSLSDFLIIFRNYGTKKFQVLEVFDKMLISTNFQNQDIK